MKICWPKSLGNCVLLLVVSFSLAANAQEAPIQAGAFPQKITYPYGIMPRAKKSSDARRAYVEWKAKHVTSRGAQGFRRVLWDDKASTVSEGIGYGMLLAANFNDKRLFDKLWGYYNLHLDPRGLMHWKIDSKGKVVGENAATDADQDVAFALILADKQWGSEGSINYLQCAREMIERIFQHEVDQNYVLKPGDVWGGAQITNPSYFAPAFYRAFEAVSGNTEWAKVIDKSYEILRLCAHPDTGLVPEWCKADGTPVDGYSYEYCYGAARAPWRIALDYIWNGNEHARLFCTKIASFAAKIGTYDIRDGYKLDGTPTGSTHASTFVGTFAVASMAAGPEFRAYCNSSYKDNVATQADTYYNSSLKALTLFVQTGNFLNPLSVLFRIDETVACCKCNCVWFVSDCLNQYVREIGRFKVAENVGIRITGDVQARADTCYSDGALRITVTGEDGKETVKEIPIECRSRHFIDEELFMADGAPLSGEAVIELLVSDWCSAVHNLKVVSLN